MDVKLTQESPIMMKADVQVPWDMVAPHYKTSLKAVAKNAQVPGFRQGKAPAALLKKRYAGQILNEVAQKVVPESMDVWIKEHDVKAVGQPRLTSIDIKDKAFLTYVAEVDILPEVELKEWRGIEVERLNVSVEDNQVDERLEEYIKQATHTHQITDRGVQKGDAVKADLTAMIDGEAVTDEEDYQLEVGGEEAHPFLSDMLLDIKTGEAVEDEFDAPEDDAFEDWRGKKVKIFLDVKDISVTHKPELDDEFAKTKDAENLADLREKTKTEMLEQAGDHEEQRMTSVLLTSMLGDYDFDVPESLIQAEAAAMVEQQMMPYMHMFQGQDPSMYRQMMDNMMQMSYPQAHAKARVDLVLEAIAKAENFEATEAEIDEELTKYAESQPGKTVEDLKAELETSGNIEHLKESLVRQKAVKAVVEAAKITLVDELTAPEGEEPEAAEAASEESGDTQAPEAAVAEAAGDDPDQSETVNE